MLLSDRDITRLSEQHALTIEPFDPALLQPASYDVLLGPDFSFIDKDPDVRDTEHVAVGDLFTLPPGRVVLGHTIEVITLSNSVAARVEGKSSMGRRGLLAHATAGFVDPGFSGQITLELYNLNKWPMTLKVGSPIAQLCFIPMLTDPSAGYGDEKFGSHYQDQRGPVSARDSVPASV